MAITSMAADTPYTLLLPFPEKGYGVADANSAQASSVGAPEVGDGATVRRPKIRAGWIAGGRLELAYFGGSLAARLRGNSFC